MEVNNITRFILDEFHDLFLSDKFRPDFTRLWEMAFRSCQRIQLSATCPPHLEKTVMKRALLKPELTQWIRGETNRPELRYHVAHVDTKKHDMVPALANIAKVLEKNHFEHISRGVIFASSIEMVKDLAKEMNCFTHHSGQKLENDINMGRWKDGGYADDDQRFITQRWMASTPGLINGIDLDRIDAVIFGEEGLGGLFGGVQGTGRGGRTGHPCMCVFVTSGTFNPPQTPEDLPCMKHMKRWTTENNCRRLVPSGVMDGKPVTCQSLTERYPTTEFCDMCRKGTDISRLIIQAIEKSPDPRHITCLDGIDDDDTSLGPKLQLTIVGSSGPPLPRKRSNIQPQPLPSSKSSHVSSTSSKPWESATPGMAIHMNKALADAVLDEKYRKRDVLDRSIKISRGCCYICWFLKGTYDSGKHQPIYGCGLGNEGWGMGWQRFKHRYMEKLEKYHFCHGCGLPQDVDFKPFQPKSHTGYGKHCSDPDFAPLIIFAAKRLPKVWKLVSTQFKLKPDMSDEEFADWVAGYSKNTDKFYNGLEVVVWFIDKYRYRTSVN
jgi:hypothetical protein